MQRPGNLLSRAASSVFAEHPLFLVLFVVLATYTWVLHHQYPLGPGQDYHFHLMVASINGRSASDPVRALYGAIDPTTTNTLLYTLAYPFEKLFPPVRAFQITVTLFYFIGLPLASAVALRRAGRAPWGALLAFPLAYYKDWAMNGFMPFLSAAPFMVLAIGEYQVVLTSRERRRRLAVITCGIACVLTFLAHGHVFVWLALLLALLTLVRMGEGAIGLPRAPKRAAIDVLATGALALAMIIPSLLLFGRWFVATHRGAHTATSNTALQTTDWPILQRLAALPGLLSPVESDVDLAYEVVLALVVLACWLSWRRGTRRTSVSGLSFEICFLATLVSYFVLPGSFNGGQTVAVRHLSLTLWLLPLVVVDAAPPRLRAREWAAVAGLAAFALLRVQFFGVQLKKLNEDDYRGLLSLARTCRDTIPRGRTAELAYAAIDRGSKYWRAALSIHQAHETFAAVCNLDTPVYDTSIYPHNFLPLRYRGGLPAPITILSANHSWYRHPKLFEQFEYVLVQGWHVSEVEAAKLLPEATLVARHGSFQLWRRK